MLDMLVKDPLEKVVAGSSDSEETLEWLKVGSSGFLACAQVPLPVNTV